VTDYDRIVRTGEIPGAVRERALRAVLAVSAGASGLRAVLHPLGFLCFPVERHELCGVCVHVWSPRLPRARSTTSAIHAHSWDLVSFVLSGELENVLVDVVEGESTHREFEVHSSGQRDELRATRRLVGYRIADRELNRSGETYTLAAGRFHITVAEAATTIAVGMAHAGRHDVTLGRIEDGTHVVRRELCGRSDSVAAARLVADQLSLMGIDSWT
jgi:hypothetical protein